MSQFDDLKLSSLDTAAAAKARITETYGKAKAATTDVAAKASEQAHQLGEKIAPAVKRGKQEAAKAGTKFKEVVEKQPLTLIAGAVAVGALLGSLLPKGSKRDEDA